MTRRLTALIERDDDVYVALCPEVDIAGQGKTVDEARENLREALELFFETASDEEVRDWKRKSMRTAVDSSVLPDVFSAAGAYVEESQDALRRAVEEGGLAQEDLPQFVGLQVIEVA